MSLQMLGGKKIVSQDTLAMFEVHELEVDLHNALRFRTVCHLSLFVSLSVFVSLPS